ncbi:Insulin-degrading enzyme [Auxenochlorella protothecoides]|uniref:Insulin-degrading enzyme n=1 Tax=Auxenochlorella protothecoides TaxID=3075 RepID=A0A087SAB6_AUXPR|nr:Insulin-degrading enzyme [Auxenochlorella protothecoides]KFM22670.1 Insulin-degrading enzyme [Auxenochlorella protothecoides]
MVAVIKSPADKKDYRYIVLDNGLRALLIHDGEIVDTTQEDAEEAEPVSHSGSSSESGSESEGSDAEGEGDIEAEAPAGGVKKAAAALSVGIGSFSDPWELQGLSHYLEHMLFMGSEKFPDENDFDSFLTAHGGASNACTENATTFYFDCKPSALQGALQRFSQFFVAPLIKADALEREVQAVDNEFTGVAQSDGCRAQQLRAHTARPGHELSKFGWGNRRSLAQEPAAAGVDVRGGLVRHYTQQYSAERMNLVLLGGETLDELEAWVRDEFRGVPGGRGPRPSYAEAGFPFQGGRLYCLQAVRQAHHLQLTFQLPCLHAEYRKKADDYLSHLIGHEGRGSLLSALKSRGWASELSGGVTEQSTAFYLFDIVISLTEAGLAHGSGAGLACVELVFAYLELLRKSGPQKWAWEEMANVAAMKFRFQEEDDVSNLVTNLSMDMHRYPPEHTLVGDYVHELWDEKLIASLLDSMTPQTVRIDIQTSKYEEVCKALASEIPDIKQGVEPWFDFQYVEAVIPGDLLERWQGARATEDMSLPPPNHFVPTDFSLCCEEAKLPAEEGPFPAPPALLVDEPGLRLWSKTDSTFRLPRTTAHFRLSSPALYDTPASAARAHLLLKLLEDRLCETSYLAEVAGLNCNTWFEGRAGIDIKVEGFSHRLPALVDAVFGTLRELDVTEEVFARVLEGLQLKYRNMNMKPHKHATYLRLLSLKESMWQASDILKELDAMTLADVRAFLSSLLGDASHTCHLEALVHGNVPPRATLDLARSVRSVLGPCATPASARPLERAVELPAGGPLLHRAGVRNGEEENSVAEVYRQAGRDGVRARALVDLVEQLVGEPCYDTLRTKEQLGYSVHSGMRLTHGLLGFAVVVVSGVHGPAYLESRILEFLAGFVSTLRGMHEEEFENHRAAVISAKMLKHRSMVEEADGMWEAVTSQKYDFDARAREVEVLQQLTLPEVKAFYEECIAPSASTLRQLSVHVVGKAHQAELSADAGEGVTLLSDPSSLHQRLPLADLEATDPGAPMGVPAAGPQSDAPAAKRLKGA